MQPRSHTRKVIASVEETINAPINEIWPFVSAIGAKKIFIPGCLKSSLVSGSGKGAIRRMVFKDVVFNEKIEDCDPETHRFVYRLLGPYTFPAKGPVGVLQLTAIGEGQKKMTSSSHADEISEGMEAVLEEMARRTYAAGMGVLRKICED
ncbi:hypothetical protein QQX98_008956 [Neonectria punicea]|uniref:SRPBCC family protein n=1 Tax=Neonectria punicea TaxID=979145 RepID=A0ABR1GU39_9HYPO